MSERTTARRGYRGYIGSRSYFGERTPQKVQNLMIRDFCRRHGFAYLLSATEYAMPGCYLMLHDLLSQLDRIEGIVLYSIFMLPDRPERREIIVGQILGNKGSLHGALEEISVTDYESYKKIEDIWAIRRLGERPCELRI